MKYLLSNKWGLW